MYLFLVLGLKEGLVECATVCVKSEVILGQSVINFYTLLIGFALKCYKGQLRVTKDTTQEQMEIEPELVDCDETGVACASYYAKTDLTTGSEVSLAGTWGKICAEKSEYITEKFGEELSDGCVEHKEGKRVCNIEAVFLP